MGDDGPQDDLVRRGELARLRADAARMRARDIAERLERLRSGQSPNDQDLEDSRLAAVAAAKFEREEHRHAHDQHLAAARSHNSAAALLDHLGRHEAAERHRREARQQETDAGAEARAEGHGDGDGVEGRPGPTS